MFETNLLNLFFDFLDRLEIRRRILHAPYQWDDSYDFSFRQNLGLAMKDFDRFFSCPDQLCVITDELNCHYLVLPLPRGRHLLAGPYLTQSPDFLHMQQLATRLGIKDDRKMDLSSFYIHFPRVLERGEFESFLHAFSKSYLGRDDFAQIRLPLSLPRPTDLLSVQGRKTEQAAFSLLEDRYAKEAEGLRYITEGNASAAEAAFTDHVFDSLENRAPSSLRSSKNYLIVCNTLFRKATEAAGVHPYYLNEISRKFAIRIENMQELPQNYSFQRDMIHQYCNLVQSHRGGGQSELISRVNNYIDANLDGDLSLQFIANYYSVNKSYLSTRFKKEMGQTLSSYILDRRLDRAIYLLNIDAGSIQEIAVACGIPDLSYFTKLFHREKKMTPSQYRKIIRSS